MEALKCQMCGGELALDAEHDLYQCEYCGTKYPRMAKSEGVSGPAEDPEGISSLEKLIQNGCMMLERGDVAKARAYFHKATAHYPQDFRGWWYLFVCDTKSVAAIRPGEPLYKTSELEHALQTAPEDVLPDLLRQYRAFAGQCLRKGCELEAARVAGECNQLGVRIAVHASALAKGEKKYQESVKNKSFNTVFYIVCIIFILVMIFNFFQPSLWMLLTIPLGLFGLLMVLSALIDTTKKDNQEHARAKARLLVLKSIKLVHLQKLNKYMLELPGMLEKLTVADILGKQRRAA